MSKMSLFDALIQNGPKDTWEKLCPYLTPTCTVVVSAGLGYIFYKSCQTYWRRRRLLGLIGWKRQQRDAQIGRLQEWLSNGDQGRRGDIVSLGFDQLRDQLQSGRLSAVQVLEAYQWRALQAHQQTNCVCEFLLEARDWAKKLDEEYADNAHKPPLFGIPVSVKESNRLIGHDSTIGFAQYIGQPADTDSALVMVLKELGAVPFVTTNIPQSMLSIGSSNAVYGVTTNPYDPSRSSGGSSSGEGALIALRGSPLGIGTDVGGSVRIPAHWCGIYSLKPSVVRLAQGGRRGAMPGQTSIKGTAGPMGPDVDSLAWFMRSVCDRPMFDMDPYVVPCPFDESQYSGDNGPLTIGYYDYDGWLRASSPCRRAVDVARELLEGKGHKLVRVALPFDSKEMHQLFAAYTSAMIPDGGKYLADLCSMDIVDPFHTELMGLMAQPNWYRRLRARLARSDRSATIIGSFAGDTTEQRAYYSQIDAYRNRFLKFWQMHKLDALICPAGACPPLPYSIPPKLFVILWAYCALYNLLDYPAGIVPCTSVSTRDEEEAIREGREKHGDQMDWISRLIGDNARDTKGLPIGVQCVALPYREEMCLRVMKEIEMAVKEDELKGK